MNRNVLTELPSQPPQHEFVEHVSAQSPFQQQPLQPMKTTRSPKSQHSLSGLATEIRDQDKGFLGWWYRLTCPKISPETAKSLEEREKIRKARLASLTLLVMCGFIMLPVPVGLINHNIPMLGSILSTLLLYGIALLCNRKNNLVLAGFLTVLAFSLGLLNYLLTFPGGLNTGVLPSYDLFLEASLVSVAFFPARSVFIVSAFNIAIIIGTILLLPKAPDLVAFLHRDTYDVLIRPITLQLFAAFVVYVWVNSAYKAILRADHAEEIAELERREVERRQQEIEQKKQLDQGIEQILASLNKVANGDTHVKVPLDQNNVLWRVGYSINNLLARIQAFKEERAELIRTRQVAVVLIETLKRGQLPNFNEWTHTCLDALVVELRKTPNWQQSQTGPSPSGNQKNLRNS